MSTKDIRILLGILAALVGGGGIVCSNRNNAKIESLEESQKPYVPLWEQEHSKVYLFAVTHPLRAECMSDELVKRYQLHAKRTIATLEELKKQGIDDIVMEGFTPEKARMLSNPNVKAEGVGGQQIYIGPLLDYLRSNGWRIHGAENSTIEEEAGTYHRKIQEINEKWKRMADREINQNGFSQQILDKYSDLMQAEARAFLESEQGRRYFEIAHYVRNKIMLRNINDVLSTGREVVFWGGATHGKFLAEALKDNNTRFTLYSDNPDAMEWGGRKAFIEQTIPGRLVWR